VTARSGLQPNYILSGGKVGKVIILCSLTEILMPDGHSTESTGTIPPVANQLPGGYANVSRCGKCYISVM
jgi:hypothetical protein